MGYTLGEAAKACGKSKATLSKAIKQGKISAAKNDNGSFSIEAAELHRVYAINTETANSEQSGTDKDAVVNTQKDNEIGLLKVKLEAAQQRIIDLEKDKDWLQAQTTRLLTVQEDSKQGFLSKLFSSK
jgi:hypothetical protein